MQSRAYKRVPREDEGTEEENKVKLQKAERMERIGAKFHAMFWIVLGGLVAYFTNIFDRALHDENVNRPFFNISVISFVCTFTIMLYLTLWLPLVQKVTVPWDIYCPNLIPISTFLGSVCFICIIVALWPLYGLLTPLIIFSMLMGLIFTTHFIPWPC